MDRVERIAKMEQSLEEAEAAVEKLRLAFEEYLSVRPKLSELYSYYGSDWIGDYEADSAGLLPQELKRGVLSEDGYSTLCQMSADCLRKCSRTPKSC